LEQLFDFALQRELDSSTVIIGAIRHQREDD
jgi:hypothetical protein